jgi:hypothetical protein
LGISTYAFAAYKNSENVAKLISFDTVTFQIIDSGEWPVGVEWQSMCVNSDDLNNKDAWLFGFTSDASG